ncbi:MAG TPA: alpha-1 6-glucosidase, partial [Actinophytocola sp.]|nr:alpha-1 6-glucosidase [Actinophytocola sp.]
MSVRRAAVALLVPLVAAGLTATVTPAAASAGRGPEALHSLRGPVTDENFYFVMADRFDNGDPGNDRGGLGDDPLVSGFDPTRKGFYNGGDLDGLLRRIDYIRGLGTTS